MRPLLASAAVAAIATAMVSPAAAETVISTATTVPVTTSALGDIRISTTGSIKLTSGNAVTINSSHKVTNEGEIAITGSNGSSAILANPGLTGDITNKGTIQVVEDYTPADSDNDGDKDGPFALGNNRFGIRIAPGGTYTGNVVNSGTITVEGNQSAGIAIDSALTGNLSTTGKIIVTGDNSVGIRTGAVSGNVVIGNLSETEVQGANSVGVLVGGDVGGALIVQGNIATSGYRTATLPSDTSKLDADDLLQGGSALVVAGDVAGGILIDTRPADNSTTDTDEDDDGIPDASESTGTIESFGAAPAVQIGSSAEAIAIGKVGSSDFSLINRGVITGAGVYAGVGATGVKIGGTGHGVTFAGALANSGAISATANSASATALAIGAGATLPNIANSGSIAATGGGDADDRATAILVDSGANVASLTNSGSITATRSGSAGGAAAIVDMSGTLATIQNGGQIGVANADEVGDSATAIDLRLNTSGATIRQVAAASGRPAPIILGDIYLGTGNDLLDVQSGKIIGDIDFGGGSDVLLLNGGSLFQGDLANSAGLAVAVGGGSTFNATNVGTVNLASLTAAANANIGVTIGDGANTLYNVAGTATFGEGTKVLINIDSFANAEGTFTIVDAGTLVGGDNLTGAVTVLPFLFDSEVTANSADGTVQVEVSLKGDEELQLNRSEAAILGAALDAVDADRPVALALLGVTDAGQLKSELQQLMPEHAGGVFETATKGSRLSAQFLGMPGMPSGLWLQQVAWGSAKSVGDTASYKLASWGATGGYDLALGKFGAVGLTGAYYFGRDTHLDNDLSSDQYEGGLYWRGTWGPVRAYARGTAGTVEFKSTRNFTGVVGGSAVSRSATGKWKGKTASFTAGLSYEARIGRVTLRPNARVDYFKLDEDGFTETGGGPAIDLTVRSRDSHESAVEGSLAFGYDLLKPNPGQMWMRVEVEAGRRQILKSKVADTVASFGAGLPFTLQPDKRTSGWRGAARLLGGGEIASVAAEANAEERQGNVGIAGRLGVKLKL